MNESQYKALCEACDRVLNLPDTSTARVAISWLHIIREHPALLRDYEGLFLSESRFIKILKISLVRLRYCLFWCWQLLRSLVTQGQPWISSSDLPQQIDVLLVSHLVSAAHAGKSDDFYYGSLPTRLAQRGYSVVVALINHSSEPEAALANRWSPDDVPRLVLSKSIFFTAEISNLSKLIEESKRLRMIAAVEGMGLYQSVLVRASWEALSAGARTTLRIGYQIGKLVCRHPTKVLLVTHEGHAWERVAFAAARRASGTVRCIGYQHALLFRLQHAIERNLAKVYNPDEIQTSGLVAFNRLKNVLEPTGVKVSVLGCSRSIATTGTPLHTYMIRPEFKKQKPVCLVLPEGIKSECEFMFKYSSKCAMICPGVTFILRLHPIIKLESLVRGNPLIKKLPMNLVLSTAELSEDIAQSTWALYRGTTAIVQAVMGGVRPVYLMKFNEMSIDPLYELGKGRLKVTSAIELMEMMHHESSRDGQFLHDEAEEARVYCESLFTPLDETVITSRLPHPSGTAVKDFSLSS